ncbi:SatD family protein [Antarcticibacterium sp. 1MA-6-2]|uniref:SatD family protein n=1 Tax=Antarcticibacterium sp. 1MA-6-2 TaxID=2908210 RepID=UPI001F3C38CD|nr:SatD family protein [Antarcticibacterium sp. 1MA-6-2]UJH91779.1 SatD family protein [Antarcticibacterium sp. 1MA-6-2]
MIAVLTADLIDSTHYEEEVLEIVLNKLREEFQEIYRQYGEDMVRFTIYRGDSFQGIIKRPEEALQIALQIKSAVNSIHLKKTRKSRNYSKIADFKLAIGLGTQELDREEITESNGQAFQFSGRTLDEMKGSSRHTGIKTPRDDVDEEFNTSFLLLDTITDKWSTASAEVVYYLLKGLKEREVASEINISQSAVNQRKKAAGWEAVSLLLTRFREVIKKQFINGK